MCKDCAKIHPISKTEGLLFALKINDDLARRAQNILRNDGENIPIFLFLAMTYVQLNCWETGVLIYFPLFVVARIIHAIAYIRAIQPLRNIVYLIGIGISFVLCSHIAWEIIS